MMVDNSDKIQFDFKSDFGESNYKSCFARSVVVNSQFHSKSLDLRQFRNLESDKTIVNGLLSELSHPSEAKMKKEQQIEIEDRNRRLSCCSNTSGSGSTGSNGPSRRGSDLPVENLALQNQVDTLQWQLKQAEASKEMYRAVMKQVVEFLERAHRSLDIFSEKQMRTGRVTRSKSEYPLMSPSATLTPESGLSTIPNGRQSQDNYATFRDFTWRKPKPQPTLPDEIPPEKLSQEAFRLLRTAQSLLNTRIPDLAHVSEPKEPKDQEEFLSQLAREFPSRPQRTTSFSINPQLVNPGDRDIRISTAFNRKLSLQRTSTIDYRRDSLKTETLKKELFPPRSDSFLEKRNSVSSIPCLKKTEKFCYESMNCDKSSSPKNGSVSSADESGFSSLNSFHEVGIPVINTSHVHNDDLRNEESLESCDSTVTQVNVECINAENKTDKAKLIWNRPDVERAILHRRWSSTPVEVAQKDPLKVFWV